MPYRLPEKHSLEPVPPRTALLVASGDLRASLTKAGVKHSFLWGESFEAPAFRAKLREWIDTGSVAHDFSRADRDAQRPRPSS